MKNVLELFSGTRSIGKEAEKNGHNVFSVDWTNYKDTDLVIDIAKLKMEDIPFVPDFIWASPDCSTYSIAACGLHRHPNKEPKTKKAMDSDNMNQHWIGLVKKWLKINPDMVFFIENPRGNLRKMSWMQEFTRHTVWYCQYGDFRAKPTDIWTNSKTWIPRPQCKNFSYNPDGTIENRHCHHASARRGSATGTQSIKGTHLRSVIPIELCESVIKTL